MIEKLVIKIDTDENSAEIEVAMSGKNLIIAAGRILGLAAKETGIDIEILAMSLVKAETGNESKWFVRSCLGV